MGASQWMSQQSLLPALHVTGHFRDGSFQTNCIGTDKHIHNNSQKKVQNQQTKPT